MAEGRDDDELLRETLVDRARKAVDRARETVRASEILAETSAAVRAELGARCAWCGRYRVGEKWLDEDELPAFATGSRGLTNISHGICPACTDALRASGKSV